MYEKKAWIRPALRVHDRGLAREIVSFSGWMSLVHISGRLVFAVMPSVLAITSGTWQIALFGLASSLEGYVFSIANALGKMFMPRVSKVAVSRAFRGDLQLLTIRVARYQVVLVGLIFVVFAGAGRAFIVAWLGEQYLEVYWLTLLLILPSLVELPQVVADTAVSVFGAVRSKAIVYAGMAVINICLGLWLSNVFGALGACVSILVAYSVRTVGMNFIYFRTLKMNLVRYFSDVYFRWGVALVSGLAVGALVGRVSLESTWFEFLLEASVVALVYLTMVFFIYLPSDTRQRLLKL